MRHSLVSAQIERRQGHRGQCQRQIAPCRGHRETVPTGFHVEATETVPTEGSGDSGPLWGPGYTQTSLSQYHFVKGDTPHHKDGIHTGF